VEPLLGLLGIAVVLFVSTNIDDVFVLLGFFSDPKVKFRHVVLGQYLGIGARYGVRLTYSTVISLCRSCTETNSSHLS
jgi:cadmium resistance protein CadD (predicted permease)